MHVEIAFYYIICVFLDIIELIKVVLINVITILIMPAKSATPSLRKS